MVSKSKTATKNSSIPPSTHNMVTRSQAKQFNGKLEVEPSKVLDSNSTSTSKEEEIMDWDLEDEMEEQPEWRPPARKKRVVPESEDDDEDEED
ncbi:hypothetical protein GCK72_025946 [Caenorhabditis remanei]|uniref:Uncharacterized protein n=1 Tax=Caenorhabditis remanei TaxID=31234 RepID=A0A6A5G3B2_CAERE|nr:hypothetical protein GCK72_025946 [Caenorhabditis remanei]KAF1749478.1 hypothetical protein GCK72_025946 [Caenorhabditis remanei]